jgi:hypothetical protein
MFFFTYLARELGRRKRQAVFIALGLAVGVGLVVTVTAASKGVQNAQAGVLRGLYGVGTDITVTKAPPPFNPGSSAGTRVTIGPSGAEVCNNGKCTNGAQTIDTLTGDGGGALSDATVTGIAKLRGVTAATGGLSLTDRQMTIPANIGSPGSSLPEPVSFTVQGTDITTAAKLGPLSDATLTGGRHFASTDADADVAIADANYATANNLKIGKTITIAKTKFTIIGLVEQPQGSTPPDVYLPLARAQALATLAGSSAKGDVNTIYVTAGSASDIPAVQQEIARLLPSATITTPSSLANAITGSLSSAAKLGQRPRQVALCSGTDRRVRGRGHLDDGGCVTAGARVRHAEGDRLAWQAHRRPGHGGVAGHGRARRGHRGGPGLRGGRDHQRDRAAALGHCHRSDGPAHCHALGREQPHRQPHGRGSTVRVGERRRDRRRGAARADRRADRRIVRQLGHLAAAPGGRADEGGVRSCTS